jgi:hypothetical protein
MQQGVCNPWDSVQWHWPLTLFPFSPSNPAVPEKPTDPCGQMQRLINYHIPFINQSLHLINHKLTSEVQLP